MATALVIGGGQNVWRDAHQALELFTPDAFFIINDLIPRWPLRADYVTTLHPEKIDKWLHWREAAKLPKPGVVWSHKRRHPAHRVDKVTNDWSGSSGLFAVKVALVEEGFRGVVLAGVPMDPNENHVLRGRKWTECQGFRQGWLRHAKEIKYQTRSMSGWTQGLFGAPDTEWLKAIGSAPPDHEMVRIIKEMADGPVEDSTRKSGRAAGGAARAV